MNWKVTVFLFLAVALMLWPFPAYSGQRPEIAAQKIGDGQRREPEKTKGNPGSWLVSGYSKYISPVNGDRCPSLPSCAAYSKAAFKKHGFFIGWIMTVDRLLHEADEASVSPRVFDGDGLKILDPVENNDFWWYAPDEKKKE